MPFNFKTPEQLELEKRFNEGVVEIEKRHSTFFSENSKPESHRGNEHKLSSYIISAISSGSAQIGFNPKDTLPRGIELEVIELFKKIYVTK